MQPDKFKLLIRCDSGPGIGTHHVQVAMKLARAWKQMRGEVTLVGGSLPGVLQRKVRRRGIGYVEITHADGGSRDVTDTLSTSKAFSPDWIAVCCDRFPPAYYRKLGRDGARLLVIENRRDPTRDCDLRLNDRVSANDLERPNLEIQSACRVLPPEWHSFRTPKSTTTRHIFGQARRFLLVTESGTPDPWIINLLKMVCGLDRPRTVVDLILDRNDRVDKQILKFRRETELHLRIHRNRDRIEWLVPVVDLAICPTRSVCLDVASYGLPSVMVCPEKSRLMHLNRHGRLVDSSRSSKRRGNSANSIQQNLNSITNDRSLRMRMAAAGRNLDHRGPERTARAMLAEFFELSPLTRQHVDEHFSLFNRWANDPETRAVSFDSGSFESQPAGLDGSRQRWLQRVADTRHHQWVVFDRHQQPVGHVGVELDGRDGRIQLRIAPSRRGMGLGSIVLEKAIQYVFQHLAVDRLVSEIRPHDSASEKMFVKAGFQATTPTTVAGKLACRLELSRLSRFEPVEPPLRKIA